MGDLSVMAFAMVLQMNPGLLTAFNVSKALEGCASAECAKSARTKGCHNQDVQDTIRVMFMCQSALVKHWASRVGSTTFAGKPNWLCPLQQSVNGWENQCKHEIGAGTSINTACNHLLLAMRLLHDLTGQWFGHKHLSKLVLRLLE